MKNLFIIKRIITDRELSDEAFVVWCGLRNIMQLNIMEYFVSYDMIAYSVFNRVPTRYELDAIKKGYMELVEKEFIIQKEVFASKTGFIVDLTALYFEVGQEYFVDLTDEEMHQIVNIDNKSKYKLLRYFACQVGTFNRSDTVQDEYKGKIGGMGLDCFVEMLGYSKVSLITYNDILSKNRLLFVHNHGDFIQGKNSAGQSVLREIPNTYARYSDKELALTFLRNVHGWKFHNTDRIIRTANANQKRALGQKLKNFKAGKEYDTETIKALYYYAEEKNEKEMAYHNAMVKNDYKNHEPDLIDMSIFDDYLLEICDGN